eukprot:m.127249 g.127249  ORF g.127249 m.127249 type:complete len:178 (+) comp23534_c0_seq3:612-1145(+)
MQLSLCEVVHSVQYDSQAIQDVCEISGRLTCKADVDKVPEVTITLESDRPLTNITTHSCILSGDFSDSSTLSRRLKFQPPAQTIDLLHYKIDQTNMPVPIRGFYQMKVRDQPVEKITFPRKQRAMYLILFKSKQKRGHKTGQRRAAAKYRQKKELLILKEVYNPSLSVLDRRQAPPV